MVVMGLNLLGTLDIEDMPKTTAQTVQIVIFDFLLILHQFLNQPQVAAHPTYIGIQLQVPVHLEDSVWVGSHSHVNQEGVLRVQLLAESVEEPVLRVQFP